MLRFSKKIHGIEFRISSQYKYAEFQFSNDIQPKSVKVKWTRKTQTVETKEKEEMDKWEKSSPAQNGDMNWRIDFPEETQSTFDLTLYKSKKTTNFEHSPCKYSVDSVIEGKWKTLATADIDLVEHIDTNTLTTKLKIGLEPNQKYVKKGVLYIDLNYELIHPQMPKSATMPRLKKDHNQILQVLKRSNDDVITLGASNQPNLSELLGKEVVLVVNQLIEVPSEFWKLLRKFVIKSKANKQDFQVVYVTFVQENEELTQIVKEEKLEFPVLKGSQALKEALELYVANGDNMNVLILTPESEISYNILGMDSIKDYFSRTTSNNFTDSCASSVSNFSVLSLTRGRTSTRDNNNSEKLFEKDRMIEILEEEKDNLKSENDHLRTDLNVLQSAVRKNENIQQEHLDTEENLEYKTKILQAERDVRATLSKRGVSGITGRKLRTRCFSFEGDMICYYDPINNKLKGKFNVTEILSMEKAPREKQDKVGVIFLVKTSNRVYEIQAMNDMQMEKWMSAVEVLKSVVSERIKRHDTM